MDGALKKYPMIHTKPETNNTSLHLKIGPNCPKRKRSSEPTIGIFRVYAIYVTFREGNLLQIFTFGPSQVRSFGSLLHGREEASCRPGTKKQRKDSVDERYLAPVGMMVILFFVGFHTSVMCDILSSTVSCI